MKSSEELSQKVESVLNSFEAVEKAEPAPFFYTRVRARLEHSEKSIWENVVSFLTRPMVAVAAVLLVIIINLAVLYKTSSTVVNTTAGTEQLTDDDYNTGGIVAYNYENPEP